MREGGREGRRDGGKDRRKRCNTGLGQTRKRRRGGGIYC